MWPSTPATPADALFDMNGNVIGITSAKYSGSTSSGASIEGISFAIPINDALRVVYDLQQYGHVTGRAYLGVTVKDLDSTTAATYGLPTGPMIRSVEAGGCAEKAGLAGGRYHHRLQRCGNFVLHRSGGSAQ